MSLVIAAILVPITARDPAGVPSSFDRTLATLQKAAWFGMSMPWGAGFSTRIRTSSRPWTLAPRSTGPEYLRGYVSALGGSPGWQATIAETGATYAIVPRKGALSDGLQRQLGWTAKANQEPYILLEAP